MDGNIILYLEILLLMCVFTMNGADEVLFNKGASHASDSIDSFGFLVSSYLGPFVFECLTWNNYTFLKNWVVGTHFSSIWFFKLFTLFQTLSHYNNSITYFSNLENKGRLTNLSSVKEEFLKCDQILIPCNTC